MTRKDWTLIAICAAKEKGLSPVQLQKSLFLLGREMKKQVGANFYKFAPYHYGPFDRTVYDDASSLAEEGFVMITRRPGENWNRYIITTAGCDRAAVLRGAAPQDAVEYLERVVSWALRQTFQGLVREIYERYPDMKVNSVFHG